MTSPSIPHEDFAEYLQELALELYPQEEWDKQNQELERISISPFELLVMRQAVYEEGFRRRPEIFEGINWINSDEGMPLWVREGVEWIPDYELDDESEDY